MSSTLSALSSNAPYFSTLNDLMYGVVGGVSSKLTPKAVRGEYHLTDFGVVPNSATDQTTLINTGLSNIGPGCKVFVPPGNYNISGITLPHSNTELYGVRGASKFTVVTNNKTAITATDKSNIDIHDLYLYGTLNGLQQEDNWGSGVILHGCSNSNLYNTIIERFARWNGSTSGVGGVWLRENNIDCRVFNNYIYNCNNGINEDAYYAASVAAGTNRNVIANNILKNNRIHIVVENQAINTSNITDFCNSALVVNNYMEGHYNDGTLNDTQYAGISIANVQDAYVSGNRITGCNTGVLLYACDQGLISNNLITESNIQGIFVLDTVASNTYPQHIAGWYNTDLSICNNYITGRRSSFSMTWANSPNISLYPGLEYMRAGVFVVGNATYTDINLSNNTIVNPIAGQGFDYGIYRRTGTVTESNNKIKNMKTSARYP